jgi:protein SCO1/2
VPGALASGKRARPCPCCTAIASVAVTAIVARIRRFAVAGPDIINPRGSREAETMIRTPQAFIPWLMMAAAVAFGLLWNAGDEVAGLGHVVATGTAAVGGPFRLTDGNGATRTDKEFRGRYLLVFFGYSFCPDVCPTTLSTIADTYAKLGARKRKIVPLFVTLDPDRDSPKVLKTYLAAFGPEFVGLTGNAAAIKSAANEYRVYYTKQALPNGGYAIDHTSVLYLMGPDGTFVTYYDDQTLSADALLADLKKRIPG